MTHAASGAVANIDYKGSKDVAYGYTIRDWVASINNVASPAGNFAADYDYYDNGNVQKAQFHNPQNQLSGHDRYHWSFGYDPLNRLTGADFAGDTVGPFDVTALTYDKAGNIKTLKRDDEAGSLIDNLSYSYSGSNRLQSVGDAVSITTPSWDAEDSNFGYDANGNLTSQTGKLTNVAYEHRNLPIHFYLNSGDELIANYNAAGQRILKELKGGSYSFYLMDGQQTLGVIQDDTLRHLNLVGNSTFGRWEPGGARRYYITDHLGSTRAVTDNNGQVLETHDYYPFGLLMPGRDGGTNTTLEKFTGKERDTEANLNLDYFGARYYDAAVGRWHNPDPLADDYPSSSPYNYTLNNPIIYKDPDGRTTVIDENGKVVQVYDDGSTAIFQQSLNDDGEVTRYENVGNTVAWDSFIDQEIYNESGEIVAKGTIDLGSRWAENTINNSLEEIGNNFYTEYVPNAFGGQKYDIKRNSPSGDPSYGSQVADGVYGSARDAGNILAGAAARQGNVNLITALSGFGALQQGQNISAAVGTNFSRYPGLAFGGLIFAVGKGNLSTVKYFGETRLSHLMQLYGYTIYSKK